MPPPPKSCIACKTSKTKCDFDPLSGKRCSRCARIGLQCEQAVPIKQGRRTVGHVGASSLAAAQAMISGHGLVGGNPPPSPLATHAESVAPTPAPLMQHGDVTARDPPPQHGAGSSRALAAGSSRASPAGDSEQSIAFLRSLCSCSGRLLGPDSLVFMLRFNAAVARRRNSFHAMSAVLSVSSALGVPLRHVLCPSTTEQDAAGLLELPSEAAAQLHRSAGYVHVRHLRDGCPHLRSNSAWESAILPMSEMLASIESSASPCPLERVIHQEDRPLALQLLVSIPLLAPGAEHALQLPVPLRIFDRQCHDYRPCQLLSRMSFSNDGRSWTYSVELTPLPSCYASCHAPHGAAGSAAIPTAVAAAPVSAPGVLASAVASVIAPATTTSPLPPPGHPPASASALSAVGAAPAAAAAACLLSAAVDMPAASVASLAPAAAAAAAALASADVLLLRDLMSQAAASAVNPMPVPTVGSLSVAPALASAGSADSLLMSDLVSEVAASAVDPSTQQSLGAEAIESCFDVLSSEAMALITLQGQEEGLIRPKFERVSRSLVDTWCDWFPGAREVVREATEERRHSGREPLGDRKGLAVMAQRIFESTVLTSIGAAAAHDMLDMATHGQTQSRIPFAGRILGVQAVETSVAGCYLVHFKSEASSEGASSSAPTSTSSPPPLCTSAPPSPPAMAWPSSKTDARAYRAWLDECTLQCRRAMLVANLLLLLSNNKTYVETRGPTQSIEDVSVESAYLFTVGVVLLLDSSLSSRPPEARKSIAWLCCLLALVFGTLVLTTTVRASVGELHDFVDWLSESLAVRVGHISTASLFHATQPLPAKALFAVAGAFGLQLSTHFVLVWLRTDRLEAVLHGWLPEAVVAFGTFALASLAERRVAWPLWVARHRAAAEDDAQVAA